MQVRNGQPRVAKRRRYAKINTFSDAARKAGDSLEFFEEVGCKGENTCPEGQWTVLRGESDDGGMRQAPAASQRRSGRLLHKMRLQAQGRAHNGKKFKETCETVVVNAHGGLLMLKHEIDNGEMLVLTNPVRWKNKSAAWCTKASPAIVGSASEWNF